MWAVTRRGEGGSDHGPMKRFGPPLALRLLRLLLLLLGPWVAGPALALEHACPSDWELEVADRINVERAAVGLPPLELDVRLVAAALRHSEDMAEGGFLSHTGSDGSRPSDRMSDAGYPTSGGETAGAGHTTPASIVAGWMNSTGHRTILLGSSYTHLGVGYAETDWFYRHYWTANFGRSQEPPHDTATFCGGGPRVCSDGIDNDGDGLTDHPDDPGCATPNQMSEISPTCGLGFEVAFLLAPLMLVRRRA